MKRDQWLLLASILLALVMWGFVIARGQSSINIEVPVTFENIPVNFRVTSGSNTSVKVSIKGHERFIKNIRPEEIKVKASLEDMKKGNNVYVINRADIELPPTLEVLSLSPSVLHLGIEETIRRKLPVRAVITGLPKNGYTVRKVEVIPMSVDAEGIRNIIKGLAQIYTKPVDIGDATNSIETEAELNISGMDIIVSDKTAMVRITIAKENQ